MDINEYDLISLIGIYTFLTSLFWGKRIMFRPSMFVIWKNTNIDEYQLVSSRNIYIALASLFLLLGLRMP